MTPLAIRRLSRRFRRHGAALVAVMAVCCAVAFHHSGLAMGDMHQDAGTSAAMELCLGIFVAVGAAAAGVAIGLIALGPRRPPRDLHALGISRGIAPPEPRARAGPVLLSVLCVCRR